MSHNSKGILGKGMLAKVRLWHVHMENRQEGKPIDTFLHVLTCCFTDMSNDMYTAAFKFKYSLTVEAEQSCACRSL